MEFRSRFRRDDKGQGLVEYGLILALVSVVAVGSLGGVGDKVTNTFDMMGDIKVKALIDKGYVPVATARELDNIRNDGKFRFGEGTLWDGYYESGYDKNYIQVSDINLSAVGNFEPLGSQDKKFVGNYDGGDYIIHNLTIHYTETRHVGLFGFVMDGHLKNIKLENVLIEGGVFVGGLVGGQQRTLVEDSYVTGSITGDNEVGGLVGNNTTKSKVIRSYSDTIVKGSYYVGGLVGNNYYSSIISSYARGTVSGYDRVGGLVGLNRTIASVVDSYAQTSVHGAGEYVGGFMEENRKGSVIKRSGWDIELYDGLGLGINEGVKDVFGYTTEEMNNLIN